MGDRKLKVGDKKFYNNCPVKILEILPSGFLFVKGYIPVNGGKI